MAQRRQLVIDVSAHQTDNAVSFSPWSAVPQHSIPSIAPRSRRVFLPAEVVRHIAHFCTEFQLYARFRLVSKTWNDVALDVLGERADALVLRGDLKDLGAIAAALRRGGKIVGTMADYGKFLKKLAAGKAFGNTEFLSAALKGLAPEVRNARRTILEREAELADLFLAISGHPDLANGTTALFQSQPDTQSTSDLSIGRVLARCKVVLSGEVIWRVAEGIAREQGLNEWCVHVEIAIAVAMPDDDLFSVVQAIVGGGVNQEERRRLTNQIIGHIKTRLCQTTSSFSQLSSRVVGAFGAAVKSFGLQPKTAANVLFILELPSETVRADIFWGLPVDEDFRASIARETYLWWRDSGSWQQKAMAFIVFARELVSPRGADTLQRIKLPGTSHAAIIAYVASGRTHIAAGRLSPIALSPFLAPIYKLPASTEEGAINSLAAMETDMQNIQFFLRSITTDSGVREFAGSVWAELLTLNLISPMVLGKALALKQRFYYVGGHFSALAKAEFVMPPRKVDRRKDVEAQEHRKIERRMVREVLKVFWMTVAQDKSIDSTLASTRIQNAISAVSLNQGELVSAAAAICPEHRGEQWAFMKSIVGSVGGASALRELWDLVLKMEKATIEKAKMSGVESRSELADDRDDVVKGTKSEMNSRGTRQQRRREKEMEDLEDGSDSSDITGDERDTKSNERRQKKGRKEAAKMSKERGRARDDKWQS